jgi:hypothetical protein
LPGTLVFHGATLDAAVAAAVTELGADVDVRAARSVKQGLRGKTHVEVLVTEPDGDPRQRDLSVSDLRPPPPPSELPASSPAQGRRRASDADPVESTLAALLASAEAEEQEFERSTSSSGSGAGSSAAAGATVIPFEAPQLAGNPTFAAEFAAAFPAALAAARAAEEGDRAPFEGSELVKARLDRVRDAVADDFTARVRDALQRVPQEEEPEDADDATEELQVIRADGLPGHPALELMDEPPTVVVRPAPVGSNGPSVVKSAHLEQPAPRPTPGPEPGRRSRPSPGPSAAAARPAALHRPAGSGWSSARLRDLGVPDAVLAALPAEEPADDLRWVVALTDAIAATVPAPVEDGNAHVTANGTGLRGALALLRLGVDGVPPQTLSIDGRAVPATATELALAIRAGILR